MGLETAAQVLVSIEKTDRASHRCSPACSPALHTQQREVEPTTFCSVPDRAATFHRVPRGLTVMAAASGSSTSQPSGDNFAIWALPTKIHERHVLVISLGENLRA